MEFTIKIDGRMVSVEVSGEVADCHAQFKHKAENLYHEKRRHWDDREFDEYIVATEGLLPYETVLGHVFEAYLIGLLYLPSKSPFSESYDKQKILNTPILP